MMIGIRCVKRVIYVIGMCCFLSATLGITALASISSVSIPVSYPNSESGELQLPEIGTLSGYDIDVEWLTSITSVDPGDNVRVRITISPNNGSSFERSVNVYVGGTSLGKQTSTADTLRFVTAIGPVKYKLTDPTKVGWKSDHSSTVTWGKVTYANGYLVKVYHDDKVVFQETISGRSYDVGRFFNGEAEVNVSVTAVGDFNNSKKSYLLKSDEVFAEGETNIDDADTTYGEWTGNRYLIGTDPDTYATGWICIFNSWYYFDTSGNLKTSWINNGNAWYFSDTKGEMQTGWQSIADKWYFFHASGERASGWVQTVPGNWYYLGTDGVMASGWIDYNGKWYFTGPDGLMLKKWHRINGHWYYFHEDGRMAENEMIENYVVNQEGIWLP